jgi:hypothetical protein
MQSIKSFLSKFLSKSTDSSINHTNQGSNPPESTLLIITSEGNPFNLEEAKQLIQNLQKSGLLKITEQFRFKTFGRPASPVSIMSVQPDIDGKNSMATILDDSRVAATLIRHAPEYDPTKAQYMVMHHPVTGVKCDVVLCSSNTPDITNGWRKVPSEILDTQIKVNQRVNDILEKEPITKFPRNSAALEFAMEPRKTMAELTAEGRAELRTCTSCYKKTPFPTDTPPCAIALICQHCGAPLIRVSPELDHVRPELVNRVFGYRNRGLLHVNCPWCNKKNYAITAPANSVSISHYVTKEPQNPQALFRMQVDCVHCKKEFWLEW